MLLSIDRVLGLLLEGKTIPEIAKLANAEVEVVYQLLHEARDAINLYNKNKARKKITLKKKDIIREDDFLSSPQIDNLEYKKIFRGAELLTIPVESTLIMNIAGVVEKKFNYSGIGIVIYNREGNQIGKISSYLGKSLKITANYVKYVALIRALNFAAYFRTKNLKLKVDSALIVKQVNEGMTLDDQNLKPLYEQVSQARDHYKKFSLEFLSPHLNTKANYLAERSFQSKINK